MIFAIQTFHEIIFLNITILMDISPIPTYFDYIYRQPNKLGYISGVEQGTGKPETTNIAFNIVKLLGVRYWVD